jgi:TM2 domain-containing membrane protein YozV
MPARIPIKVLFQQCISRLARGFITIMRAMLVVIVWLILLPTLTLWTWRFYFWSGKNIGFTVTHTSNRLLLNHSHSLDRDHEVEEASIFLLHYNLR